MKPLATWTIKGFPNSDVVTHCQWTSREPWVSARIYCFNPCTLELYCQNSFFFRTWDCSLKTESRTREWGPIYTWLEPAGLGEEILKVRKWKPKDFARVRPIINPAKVSPHRPGVIKLESTKQDLDSIIQTLGIRTISQTGVRIHCEMIPFSGSQTIVNLVLLRILTSYHRGCWWVSKLQGPRWVVCR